MQRAMALSSADKPVSTSAGAFAKAAKGARTNWVSLPDEGPTGRQTPLFPAARPWNWKPTAIGLAGIATVLFVLFNSGGRRS
jgi:hypothetical protein